eukprot:1161518-Pelagomonas_calceolata.AAC.8
MLCAGADAVGADAVCHGATGKGNDQVSALGGREMRCWLSLQLFCMLPASQHCVVLEVRSHSSALQHRTDAWTALHTLRAQQHPVNSTSHSSALQHRTDA